MHTNHVTTMPDQKLIQCVALPRRETEMMSSEIVHVAGGWVAGAVRIFTKAAADPRVQWATNALSQTAFVRAVEATADYASEAWAQRSAAAERKRAAQARHEHLLYVRSNQG